MSGIKHSTATLSADRQRQIEDERRRQAIEELQRRQEAEARHRMEDLDRRWSGADDSVSSASVAFESVLGAYEPYLDASQAGGIRGTLSEMQNRIREIRGSETGIGRLVQDVREVQQRIGQMAAKAREAQRTHDLEAKRLEAQRREEEGRRLREEARKRKVEAAEKRRKDRLDEDWKTSLALVRDFETAFESDLQTLADFVDRIRMAACAAEIDRLTGRLLDEKPDEAFMEAVRLKVKDLGKVARQLHLDAVDSKLSHQLEKERESINKIQRELAGIRLSIKLDSQGRIQIDDLLGSALVMISKRALEQASAITRRASEALAAHKDRVAKGLTLIEAEKAAADEGILKARSILAGLKADPAICRWMSQELDAISANLSGIEEGMDETSYVRVPRQCEDALADVPQIENRAQERQLAEDKRQYILGALCEVLRSRGFVIHAGFPVLDDAINPASDIFVMANRPGGGELAIIVPTNCDIQCDVPEWEKKVEDRGNGQIIRTCDGAEGGIKSIIVGLSPFGIDMTEPTWPGKDPDRILKEAKVIPTSPGERSGEFN